MPPGIEDRGRSWVTPQGLPRLEPLAVLNMELFETDIKDLPDAASLAPVKKKLNALHTLIAEYDAKLDRGYTQRSFLDSAADDRENELAAERHKAGLLPQVKTAYEEVQGELETAREALGKHESGGGLRARDDLTNYVRYIGEAIGRAQTNHERREIWMRAANNRLAADEEKALRERIEAWAEGVASADLQRLPQSVPRPPASLGRPSSSDGSQEALPSRAPSRYAPSLPDQQPGPGALFDSQYSGYAPMHPGRQQDQPQVPPEPPRKRKRTM